MEQELIRVAVSSFTNLIQGLLFLTGIFRGTKDWGRTGHASQAWISGLAV